ncbi:MAG: hypothetical protein AMXMBFR33_06290 [Candidatus Xenobia bacterium]
MISALSNFRCWTERRPRTSGQNPGEPAESVQLSGLPATGWKVWRAVTLATALALATACSPSPPALASQNTVKVLTLNVWHDSKEGVDQVAELIRTSGADIVGLQESSKNSPVLAEKLKFNHFQQGETTAILSRFPIERATPGKHGVVVELPSGKRLGVGNLHLNHQPYQPYQLLRIPYGDHPFIQTEAQAQEQAELARGQEIRGALQDLTALEGLPRVLTGDFNEPSHLDWTERAARAGLHPLKVDWPTSRAAEQAGWQDSFRVLNPDEVARPGWTWTPMTRPDDPADHHDRLDFVLYQGIKPLKVDIVAERPENGTIVVQPYPTDHRGVLTTFQLEP